MKLNPGEWVAKRPQTYCRQHGERISGFLNGIPLCRKCCDELLAEVPHA